MGKFIQYDLQSNTLLIQGLTYEQLRRLSNLSGVTALLRANVALVGDTCHITRAISRASWESLADTAQRLGYDVKEI